MKESLVGLASRLETNSRKPGARAAELGRSASPLIQVTGLNKVYRSRDGSLVHALSDVSLSVKDASFVSVLGPSGCGKTTLLNILAGLTRQTDGQVLLRGQTVLGPSPDIGLVFQEPVLFPWRTVLSNVELPVEILRLDRRKYRERAIALLQLTGLSGFEDKYPHELSGGMQQRVAIARSLVHDPQLLLMDEPFSSLDALTREYMNLELQRVWEEAGKTIVFITHSISEAVFLSDEVMVMTARPARLAGAVPIDLPRPRNIDMMATERFGAISAQVRKLLDPPNVRNE